MDRVTDSTLLFDETFLDISFDPERLWIHLNWKGYQTDASVKAGCEHLLELMVEHHLYKVLNDNTNALGIWIGTAPWLAFNYFPRIRRAGLTGCAHVYGPSRLSQISADAALKLLPTHTVNIQAFHEMDDARKWLSRLPESSRQPA